MEKSKKLTLIFLTIAFKIAISIVKRYKVLDHNDCEVKCNWINISPFFSL